jgi:hypothetical protein
MVSMKMTLFHGSRGTGAASRANSSRSTRGGAQLLTALYFSEFGRHAHSEAMSMWAILR